MAKSLNCYKFKDLAHARVNNATVSTCVDAVIRILEKRSLSLAEPHTEFVHAEYALLICYQC